VAPPYRLELLNAAYHRAAFSCGAPALDRYLTQQAGQDMRRGVARVFVLCENGSVDVLGYYSLSATSIEYGELPANISRRLPRYPTLPALLLGRLAVETRRQGQGLGQLLLTSALGRCLRVSQGDIAAMAVVVDAKDEDATRFYARHDFIRFPSQPMRLFLPMPTIEAIYGPPQPKA
jgi:GNAT superfamily N-acetyltransferase